MENLEFKTKEQLIEKVSELEGRLLQKEGEAVLYPTTSNKIECTPSKFGRFKKSFANFLVNNIVTSRIISFGTRLTVDSLVGTEASGYYMGGRVLYEWGNTDSDGVLDENLYDPLLVDWSGGIANFLTSSYLIYKGAKENNETKFDAGVGILSGQLLYTIYAQLFIGKAPPEVMYAGAAILAGLYSLGRRRSISGPC